MRSIEWAIAWDLWRRSRPTAVWLIPMVLAASAATWATRVGGGGTRLAESAGYAVLVAAMFAVFGSGHYTEGKRRGGFGSFPQRMFHLPVTTFRLVSLPMLYGATSVVVAYLAISLLVFEPLGRPIPILWPCLYLVSGLALYQAVVWSLPESRYWKLFLLSVAAASIAAAWMFFLPHVLEGTLSAWGYAGSPESFQRRLMLIVVATVPAALGVSWNRVGAQRHGREWRWSAGRGSFARRRQRVRASRPFGSVGEALFWHEWKQTGLLLPGALAVILGFTLVPACWGGEAGPQVTRGVLIWLLLAPLLLASVLGTGLCKPDFWREDLALAPYHAVRPATAGAWVMAKLEVTAASAVGSWLLVLAGSTVFLLLAGDFLVLDEIREFAGQWYPGARLGVIVGLSLFAGIVLTWRLMIQHLWAGLSGRKFQYRLVCGLTAAALLGLLAWLISRDESGRGGLHIYMFWRLVEWLPWVLPSAVLVKAIAGARAWSQVAGEGLLDPGSIRLAAICWLVLTLPLLALAGIAFEMPWLRCLALMVALLVVPFAGPALGILALAHNRSST